MVIGQGQRITEGGIVFELLIVNKIEADSAAAAARLAVGDQIMVDEMPAGGGPQQAQRIAAIVGTNGRTSPAREAGDARTGVSAGTKSRSASELPRYSAATSSGAFPIPDRDRRTPMLSEGEDRLRL